MGINGAGNSPTNYWYYQGVLEDIQRSNDKQNGDDGKAKQPAGEPTLDSYFKQHNLKFTDLRTRANGMLNRRDTGMVTGDKTLDTFDRTDSPAIG